MGIIAPIKNLIKYGTTDLMPQVDPEVMEPIFKENFKKLSFYSPKYSLHLRKNQIEDMRFTYTSRDRNPSIDHSFVIAGTIYAQKPRTLFSEVDVVSFMKVDDFYGEEKYFKELADAIEGIAQKAGIEKVVAFTGWPNFKLEQTKRLLDIKGSRDSWNYGIGSFVHH